MAELSFKDKKWIEEFLEMGGGYVLNFSDRTFRDFIGDAVEINIYDPKYARNSGSKANRLRQFLEIESDYTVGKLLRELESYKRDEDLRLERESNGVLYEQMHKIIERLLEGKIIDNLDAIVAINDDRDFHQLARLIKESIEKNEPESALDRLHTYLFKFLKELCKSHDVTFSDDESVNAIYGKYIRKIRDKGLIESEMAEKIIQSTFQVMQSFNDVRNNRSFAHDNPVLNYDESIFIFSNVTATVKFIQALEARHKNVAVAEAKPDWIVEF